MTDPTFRFDPEPAPPPPPAGISASGLQPPLPPARSFGPLVPRVAYAIGFVCCAALLWIRFNPVFGHTDFGRRSPMQIFQNANGDFAFTWSPEQRAVTFLVLMVLGYLAASFARAGRGRGLAVLALSLFGFLSIGPSADFLNAMLSFVAGAVICGTLFVPTERTNVWTRRAFWASLLVMAALLWMPAAATDARAPDDFRYVSVGSELVNGYMDPPTEGVEGPLESGWERFYTFFLGRVSATMALLLLILGVLAGAGLRKPWVRIAAGVTFFIMVFGSSLVFAIDAGMKHEHAELTGLQNALHGLGTFWYVQYAALAWPLAGAVRESTS